MDSAVVVELLHKAGHELHLFYIRIGMDNGEGDCSADEDIELCQLIAYKYNLPLDIIPLHEEYWQHVMKYALDTVKSGLTPHPDMMCNKIIKFGYFIDRVGYKYDRVATGHYASIVEIDGKRYLATAVDPVKDQTDFLAQISYDQLSRLMFPLGSLPKKDVRKIAEEVRLPNAGRKDSQGICFLGKIDYNEFVKRHLGEHPGPIIELETGKKLGQHNGYWFHTIGQRKGLGLSGGPWYVVRKNVRDNVVYVSQGRNTSLQYGRTLHLQPMHWISGNPFEENCKDVPVTFKNRHMPQFLTGTLTHVSADEYVLKSETDVQGIAPGQFAVIYSQDSKLCYGSGTIIAPSKKKKR